MDDFRQMINPGELTSNDTITLARTAAGAIRGLNWTAGCDAGLDQPSAAYDVPGTRSLAAARLGRAFTQITRYLTGAAQAGRLGHDLGQDPAAVFPGDAAASAAALAGDLGAARQQLAAVNGRPATTRKDQP